MQHSRWLLPSSDGVHVEDDAGEQAVLAEVRQLRREGRKLRGIAAAPNHRAYRMRRGTAWRLESDRTRRITRPPPAPTAIATCITAFAARNCASI
jgi:hypothetical protein